MKFNEEWEVSSDVSSRRDSTYRNSDLRYCPGI